MRRAYIADLRAIWPLTARIGVANAPPWHQSWPEKTVIWVMSVQHFWVARGRRRVRSSQFWSSGDSAGRTSPYQKVTPSVENSATAAWGYPVAYSFSSETSLETGAIVPASGRLPSPCCRSQGCWQGVPLAPKTAMGFCSGARRLPAPFFSRRWHWDWSATAPMASAASGTGGAGYGGLTGGSDNAATRGGTGGASGNDGRCRRRWRRGNHGRRRR